MKKRILILSAVMLVLLAALAGGMLLQATGSDGRLAGGTDAAGSTGDDALDAKLDEVLNTLCDPKASDGENLAAVYDWVCTEITYRPGTADTSGGFTQELVNELAAELLDKRRGNCDGEAALMAAFLTRMGCEATVVTGTFTRPEDGVEVEHAWVIAKAGGDYRHFDPLYGRYYTDDQARDYFAQTDAAMEQTHNWQRDAYPACD